MIVERIARDYLVPPLFSFWKWSADGSVLCWRDGKTIAFRPELDAILGRLAPAGLPPLSSIALVLGACQAEDWREVGLKDLQKFLTNLTGSPEPESFPALTFGLESIRCLPPEVRLGLPAKEALAELIFEKDPGCHSPKESKRIVQGLQNLGAPTIQHTSLLAPAIANDERLKRSLLHLSDDLQHLDFDQVKLRGRTGFNVEPKAPEEKLSLPQILGNLLGDLEADEEFGGIVRLARRMMAAATLPRPLSIPDENSLGGISDISNRGRLDRLLPTELVHEDLVLAARIANNEALYWRQEAPPKSPAHGRLLVLDCGIRLWGRSRLFAIATMLAFALRSDEKATTEVFRIRNQQLYQVDLEAKEELLDLLGALESNSHPGAILDELFKAQIDKNHNLDRILITSAKAFEDPEFISQYQAAKKAADSPDLFVATVDDSGEFQLWSLGLRGRKRWQRALLPIADVQQAGEKKRPGQALNVNIHDPALPEILFRRPFPLRLPQPDLAYSNVRTSQSFGAVSVTKDGRLLHWNHPHLGGLQISERLPQGSLNWFMISDAGDVILTFIGRNKLFFVFTTLNDHECQIVENDLVPYSLQATAHHGGAFFLIHRDQSISVYSGQSGELIQTLKCPKQLQWSHRRFFRDQEDTWWALSFTGTKAHLEKVPYATKEWWLFDRDGFDGPWAIIRNGFIGSTVDGRSYNISPKIQSPVSLINIAPSGNKMVLRGHTGQQFNRKSTSQYLVDLKTREVRAASEEEDTQLIDPPHNWKTHRLMRDVASIGALSSGQLLINIRQTSFIIESGPSGGDLILTNYQKDWPQRNVQSFPRRGLQSEKRRYGLKRVQWNDGSEGFLDSRGLLHLVSSNLRLPQISIVLNDRALAFWLSDGRTHGPAYFQHSKDQRALKSATSREILGLLRDFTRSLL
jgi:hypothetical protein